MRKVVRIALVALAACAPAAPLSINKSLPAPPTSVPDAAAPPPAPDPFPDDAEIAKATEAYLDLFVDVHPEAATALGLHRRDGELDDRSIAGHDQATAREQEMLESLERRFASPRASVAAKTDLALLLGALRVDVRVRRVDRPLQRRPQVYVEPLDAVFQLVARDFAPAPERAKDVVARLEKVPKTIALAKDNLLNPPKVWTEIAIEKASGAKAFLEQQRPFLSAALPGDARADSALKAALAAYEDYARYLRSDVMKSSNGRFAAGRELYEYLLANDAFLEEDADAVLAIGKRVFAETNDRMTELAKKIDPGAPGWPAVTAKIKGKHPTADDLVATYQKEVKRARDFLVANAAVPFPPDDDLSVIETPAFMRATLTAAYDAPPAFDDRSSKGFFFVTPIDKNDSPARQEAMLRENDYADIVDTVVHEAYPGHHLQLSFARRSPSRARRVFDHAIMSEGWALYAEELMAELGYYDDEQRLIQLQWALVRAARVVIDVGLHVGGMTFEQAVKVLTDEVHLERPLAISEARRYTEDPTQPSAYIVGREKILELRRRAREQGGASFSLERFHGDLLARGTIPPSLAAREMFPAP
ncbi:MAG: DUF885 domain-containing protein [Labilithrix sp.]|nr:DUF885 domain-containing protein [Labilithrix sp.]MCW5817936.1 DUF885 domain-containing protein [Labilithrix sp.]